MILVFNQRKAHRSHFTLGVFNMEYHKVEAMAQIKTYMIQCDTVTLAQNLLPPTCKAIIQYCMCFQK
jgi:hypothetical protein